MNRFPTLYKKTSTGAIQQWSIEANTWSHPGDPAWGVIKVRFGQVGGKIQESEEVIKEGKNAGRSNATTPEQQAHLEAEARWLKQRKKGYVLAQSDAEEDFVDVHVIEGGIPPMLAHSFAKHGDKIKYPAYVQPKLDGIRCIAVLEDGKCTLWSRTRKPIRGVPHVQLALEKAFPGCSMVLDGELYVHDYRDRFEEIVSIVRQDEPKEGHEVVEYHAYDVATPAKAMLPFHVRNSELESIMGGLRCSCLVPVPTIRVHDEGHLMVFFQEFLKEGYEGAIVRNADGKYVNKRSYDLQKIKEFDDAEFPIVGVEEGRGKLAGHGIFVCAAGNGERFSVKMSGSVEHLKRYLEDPSSWQGKKLTVQYQGLTGANGVPRFPVGLRIRGEE